MVEVSEVLRQPSNDVSDHPLEAGHVDDYLPLSAPDTWTSSWGAPRVGQDDGAVAWRRGAEERVLYLTWSSALHAEERFASFAPADVEVTDPRLRDVSRRRSYVARQPLPASRERFDAGSPGSAATWPGRGRPGSRRCMPRCAPFLLGRAIPGEAGTRGARSSDFATMPSRRASTRSTASWTTRVQDLTLVETAVVVELWPRDRPAAAADGLRLGGR